MTVMTGTNSHGAGPWRALGVLIVASGLVACDVSDDPETESAVGEELEERAYEKPEPIVLPAEADTFVRTARAVFRNDNYGCSNHIMVGSAHDDSPLPKGAPDASRALLRFDVRGLGILRVRSATLQLAASHVRTNLDIRPFEVQLHAIRPSVLQIPWVEGNGYLGPEPIPAGCTNVDDAYGVAWWSGPDPFNWQGEEHGKNNDFPPDFEPEVIASFTLDPRYSGPGDIIELDVTALVNDWLAGRRFNDGFMLRDVSTPTTGRELYFTSREGEGLEGLPGPRLVIERLPAFPDVEITADGTRATLYWGPRPNASYTIWRSTNPSFQPEDPDASIVATGLEEGTYMDDFVSRDAVFYRVVENTFGGPPESSEVVGRIPVPVRRTLSHAQNSKIPLCLAPAPADAHQQMLLRERPLSIHWWDPFMQSFAADGFPFEAVLDRAVGEVISVRTPPSPPPAFVRYQLTGRVPSECEIANGMVEGFNAVAWPVFYEPTMASRVLAMFPGAVAVGRWPVLQEGNQVEWYPAIPAKGLPGVTNTTRGDFEIPPCTALYVYMDVFADSEGVPIDVIWPTVVPECEG